MLILILSLVTFFNLIILHIKYKQERFRDIMLDIAIWVGLSVVSGGTLTGLAIATTVSFMMSLYLLIVIKR